MEDHERRQREQRRKLDLSFPERVEVRLIRERAVLDGVRESTETFNA